MLLPAALLLPAAVMPVPAVLRMALAQVSVILWAKEGEKRTECDGCGADADEQTISELHVMWCWKS